MKSIMGFIMLLLGLTTQPNSTVYNGICRGIEERIVPCQMQKQPFGIQYVTDGKSVYQFRPVFLGGFYSVKKDGKPLGGDQCRAIANDIYCRNTIIFIENYENNSDSSFPPSNSTSPRRDN